MNEPYAPAPGYSNQPGYPPPPRQGMGCFAKGCLTVVIVFMLLGLLIGGAGWFLFRNFTAFFSPTPVAVRTYPATEEQYQAVLGRYTDFIKALNAGQAATFSLSSDDLNTLIARDPEFKDVRGKLYLTIEKEEVVAEASFPVPEDNKRLGSSARNKGYFNGRMRFGASYSGGEISLFIRQIESMKGDAMASVVVSFINKMEFGKIFTDSMHDERRKGTPWAEAMARVQKVVIENDHIVATAEASTPAINPVPLPGELPESAAPTPAPTAPTPPPANPNDT